MADLMQKTKRELILMLQDKELAIQSLQNAQLVPRVDYESVLDELEQLKIVNNELGGQNEVLTAEKNQLVMEKQRLQSELENAIYENHQLQDEIRRIQEAYEKTMIHCESLKKEHDAFENHSKMISHQSYIAYELFKSFVDSDSRKVFLIDTAYTVCYINQSAAAYLQLSEPGVITGCRLFDFFTYKDGLKVKNKIDDAFFSGEKEKIKGVNFLNPCGGKTQIDLKMSRVRYQDKPSIKMTIK